MRRFIPLLLVLALSPSTAAAHDLWIEKQDGGYVLQYGHRGGEIMPIEASKLKSATCVDVAGAKTDLLARAAFAPKAVRFKAACAAVSAFLHGGFFSLTPDGEQNLPKNGVKDAVKSWESREFTKFVTPAGAARPTGIEMEIVSVTDLAKLREGDKVTLRVLVDGVPAAGAAVARAHSPVGETDGNGEVRLKIKATGLQVIEATVKKRIDTPEADSLIRTATLVFEVPK